MPTKDNFRYNGSSYGNGYVKGHIKKGRLTKETFKVKPMVLHEGIAVSEIFHSGYFTFIEDFGIRAVGFEKKSGSL
jgi:hypothetical protein